MKEKTNQSRGKTIQVQKPHDSFKTMKSARYPNLEVLLKVPLALANNAYEVWQISNPDQEVALPFIEHHHTYCSIVVTSGSMEMRIGNDTSKADYGSIVHMLPYTPHAMTLAKDTTMIVVYAGPGIEKGLDSDLHDPGEVVALPWADPEIGKLRKQEDYIEGFRLAPFFFMTNKISPNETNGLYQLEFLQVETSANMPPGKPMLWDLHFHQQHCETFIVLEGSAIMGNEKGKLFTLQPGTLCHCPVSAEHTLIVTEDSIIAAVCNPPDYQMKINQMKTMMKYHANMMFEPDFVDFQDQWDRQFEHHSLSKEYTGIIEAIDGPVLQINIGGKIKNIDISANYYMYEPEVGTKVKVLGSPAEGDKIIGWKAWKI